MENFANLNELVFPMVVIAMPIGIIAVVAHFKTKEREMIHRERMLAMEKGLQPPPEPFPNGARLFQDAATRAIEKGLRTPQRDLLFRGLLWLAIGIGALASMIWARSPLGVHLQEPFSLLTSMPFLAFIPIGVGLAHLVYYAIEGQQRNPPAA
jgi:hypothetical protein